MQPGPQPPAGAVVREPTWVWVLVWTGFPLVGGVVGWLLVRVADRAADARWVPFKGLFRLIDRHSGAPLTIGAIAVGAILGLLLALTAQGEKLTVTVDREGVDLIRDGRTRRVARADADAVLLDGKQLVVLDATGRELARDKSDLDRRRLADAFTANGWPWRDSDPYAGDFRRWVEGLPDLPPGADPLLRARSRVLGRNADDAAELRSELARIGIVVRDERRHQYIRTLR